jgi:hypothetical protein
LRARFLGNLIQIGFVTAGKRRDLVRRGTMNRKKGAPKRVPLANLAGDG